MLSNFVTGSYKAIALRQSTQPMGLINTSSNVISFGCFFYSPSKTWLVMSRLVGPYQISVWQFNSISLLGKSTFVLLTLHRRRTFSISTAISLSAGTFPAKNSIHYMDWLTVNGGAPSWILIPLGIYYENQYYLSDECLSE